MTSILDRTWPVIVSRIRCAGASRCIVRLFFVSATPTAAPAADRPTSLSLPLALLSLTVLALFRGGQERRAHIKPLTREEVTVLLREAESCYPVIFPLLLCAVGADLRLGEVIGLQWGDADFRGGG